MDSVTAELESMRQIAAALDRLQDVETRQRVLQWAVDRYAEPPTSHTGTTVSSRAEPAALAAAPARAADDDLVVEQLEDLFATIHSEQVAPPRTLGVETMIRDFADDFRRFALEW